MHQVKDENTEENQSAFCDVCKRWLTKCAFDVRQWLRATAGKRTICYKCRFSSCAHCGNIRAMTKDHIVPKCRGETLPLCSWCNHNKGSMGLSECLHATCMGSPVEICSRYFAHAFNMTIIYDRVSSGMIPSFFGSLWHAWLGARCSVAGQVYMVVLIEAGSARLHSKAAYSFALSMNPRKCRGAPLPNRYFSLWLEEIASIC